MNKIQEKRIFLLQKYNKESFPLQQDWAIQV